MIVKRLARNEVTGELCAASMAGRARFHDLVAVELVECGIFLAGERGLFLPLDVGFHRAVAGFTTDAHFRHGGMIAVGLGFVIFPQAGVMTSGAHGVPVHALAGPVSPVTGAAFFVAIDIEPFVFLGVEGDIAGLQSTAGSGDEELSQGIVANDADDGEGVAFFVETDR